MDEITGSNPVSPIGEEAMVAKKRTVRKVKKKAEETESYEVYLIYDSETWGGAVCKGDEGSDWPNHEPTNTSFTPKGLRLKAPGWSETIKVDFDPSRSKHLYVVIVRYSSGGTFGTTHGNWHIQGAYKSYVKAEKVEIAISNSKGKYAEGNYNPWQGYFESLEKVTIERLDIWE